jgi:hypothetical protein
MPQHLDKVVTTPLSLVGYSIFLVFGIVKLVARTHTKSREWIIKAGFAMAAICVLSGLFLAYREQDKPSAAQKQSNAPSPTMSIGTIDQEVGNGNAVAGVQGAVNDNNTSAPPAKAKKDDKK